MRLGITIVALGVSLVCFNMVQAADKAAPEQRPEAGAGFMKPALAPDAILPPGIAKREDGFPGQGKHLGLGMGKGLTIAAEKAEAGNAQEGVEEQKAGERGAGLDLGRETGNGEKHSEAVVKGPIVGE